ncbi:hypothetical protein EVAR_39127_1 [Eumeta japonica]|uniref:Uncharacterized protein n=1 Tax=Eumeta variegata TaxID=151549 RepID=A0A4C1X3X1_EUMVA|nr:hypothetical protein EVAR_39127_1 [Eumeta japonica]
MLDHHMRFILLSTSSGDRLDDVVYLFKHNITSHMSCRCCRGSGMEQETYLLFYLVPAAFGLHGRVEDDVMVRKIDFKYHHVSVATRSGPRTTLVINKK